MGFIGKIFRTIFNPRVPTVNYTAQTVSGRDLLSSTESEEPESPLMGSEKKKRKGIESLMVPSESLYTGGGK